MACLYTLRLPLRHDLSANDILCALARWVNADAGNSFTDLFLTEVTSRTEYSCPELRLCLLPAVATPSGAVYTAVRLESRGGLSPSLPLRDNLLWTVDLLSEDTGDKRFVTLQIHAAPPDPAKSFEIPAFSVPDFLFELAKQAFFVPEGGFPIQTSPLTMSPELDSGLRGVLNGSVLTDFPLLLVREGNYAFTPKLSERLCRCAHVCILPAIHPTLLGLGAGNARLLVPRLGLSQAVDLTSPTAAEDLPARICELTRRSQTAPLPAFAYLELLSRQQPLQPQNTANFLCMNRKMADSIRFYRIKNGLTQTELAQKAGVTGLLISRLENNRPARVRDSLIAALEEALQLHNRELCSCEGLPEVPETPTPKPVFCTACGTKAAEGSHFCRNCGTRLL